MRSMNEGDGKAMKLWRYGRSIESLGQRYRLEGMLGSGGMADVCLAWDEREEREVAVKLLKADDLDQETLNRFMKEAARIAGWRHPNILRVYESLQVELVDAARGSALFYMVVEYARGGDLHKRLTPGRPFPLAATFALFRQLCGAVQYAHDQRVIHRDLKPLNILFRRPARGPEEVVLSDFGLAVQVDASHHTFARGGTLAYMAPEQFRGHAQPASDIFALGVILYQLCTGYLPFRRTVQDIARLLDSPPETPTLPHLLNPELPAALDEVILRALRELPAERYTGAREFWDAVALALLSAAPTFPIEDVAEYRAGRTWPIENAERPPELSEFPASQTGGDSAQSRAVFGSLPEDLAPRSGEGPGSGPGSVREKQKASPARTPGQSLPLYSIPAQPNPPVQFAPGGAQPRPLRTEETGQEESGEHEPRSLTGAVWGEEESETPPATSRVSHAPRAFRPPYAPHTRGGKTFFPHPQAPGARAGATFTNDESAGEEWDAVGNDESAGEEWGAMDEDTLTRLRQATGVPERASAKRLPGKTNKNDTSPMHVAPPLARGAWERRRTENVPPLARGAGRKKRVENVPPLAPRARKMRLDRRRLLPILAALALPILLAAIVLAASSQGWLPHLFGAPITTVTLTPRSQMVQQDLTLTTVAANSDSARAQVQARLLTAASPTQSTTVNASGSIQAKRATGILTFINNGSTPVTVRPTFITDNNGIQVSFNDTVIVPAVPPSSITVLGFAVNPGTAGNISVLDIVKSCCAPNIIVKNTTAFTGGQDAQPNSVIEQKDIDNAANGLTTTLKQDALNALQEQVRSTERVIASSQQCQPQISANHRAGDVAKTVTVQVAVTCSEQVYDYSAAQRIALRELQSQVGGDPNLGAAYALDGQVALSLLNAGPPGADGGFALHVQARSLWVYSFSRSVLSRLAAQIAGKSEDEARRFLLAQPGVVSVSFHPSGTLPVNPDEIQIVTHAVPGATGTPGAA